MISDEADTYAYDMMAWRDDDSRLSGIITEWIYDNKDALDSCINGEDDGLNGKFMYVCYMRFVYCIHPCRSKVVHQW